MKVELTNEEIAERGRELAGLIQKLIEAREDKKDSAKTYAETIAGLEKRIVKLSEVVRAGIEIRSDQQALFENNHGERLANAMEEELQKHPIDGVSEVSVSRGGRKRTLYKAKVSSV